MTKKSVLSLRSSNVIEEDSAGSTTKTNKKNVRWLRGIKMPSLSSVKLRVVLLVMTFTGLCFLFLSPPVKLTKEWEEYKNKHDNSVTPLDKSTTDYLMVEHQKMNDEIRLRTEAQDSWLHYKFILTGGMVALLLGQIGLGQFGLDRKNRPAAGKPRRWMKNFFSSETAYLILALSCVVSFIIDMHIRSQSSANQRLGLWISNYVEPSLVTPRDINVLGFRPWEQFLRMPTTDLWLDNLYRVSYGLHLHYMTIFIYLLYSLQLQDVCLGFVNNEKNNGQRMAVVAGCVFVLLSVLAFTVVSHTIPPTAEMRLFHSNDYVNGFAGTLYYSIPLLFLLAFHLPYLWLVRTPPPRTTAPTH